MDGLSVAANLIAVINAAQYATQELRKLYGLRKAPEQVLLLLGEVPELTTILSIVQETLDQLLACHQFQDPIFNRHLTRTIQNAFDTLDEVNGVIQSGLIKNFDQMSNERVKISRKLWLKKHNYLNMVSTKLRNVKTDIASSLTILTSSEVPRLRASLHKILLDNQHMAQSLQSLEQELSPLSPTFEKLQEALDCLQPKPSTEDVALPQSSQAQLELSKPSRNQNLPQTECKKLCICRCHEQKSFTSPRWTATIFGQLFLAYSGTALSQNHSCNIVSCQEWRSKQVVFRATYFFPTWFLQRVLVICDRWTPMEHSISIRTPRVLPHDPRFFAAQMGKTHVLQKLFSDGIGSPFDTRDGDKNSLLSFAVVYKRVETCRFLLQNYADPEQEDTMAR